MVNCWSRDKGVTLPWVGRSRTCNRVVKVDGFGGIAVCGGEISLLCLFVGRVLFGSLRDTVLMLLTKVVYCCLCWWPGWGLIKICMMQRECKFSISQPASVSFWSYKRSVDCEKSCILALVDISCVCRAIGCHLKSLFFFPLLWRYLEGVSVGPSNNWCTDNSCVETFYISDHPLHEWSSGS